MTFSLSYEQLTREAEEEIKKCNLDKDKYFYGRELDKASALLLFWYRLAIVGYAGGTGNEREAVLAAIVSRPLQRNSYNLILSA